MYRKVIATLMLSAGLCSGTSALASGIPTVDAAAIANGAAAYADAADVLEHGPAVQHGSQHAAKLHRNSRIGTGGLQPEPEKSDTNLRPQSSQRNNERHLVTQQFGPRYF